MITDTQKRNQLLRRISKIPKDKLDELEEFIANLEKVTAKKRNVLSFAGAWKDIDNSILDDFTENLIDNRRKNRPRIDE